MVDKTIRHIGEAVDSVGDGEYVYSIGLASQTEVADDTFALIFSVTEPTAMGNGYSLVVEPGQRCAYGCVTSCQLETSLLQLELDKLAAEVLDLPRELALALELSEPDLARVRLGLARIGINAD